MAVIKVPRPKSVVNPNRPASSLLLAQVQHLHQAEKRLPIHHRSKLYVNAICTEGEAAEYIREVTDSIHRAHEEARTRRHKRSKRQENRISIAAAAQRVRPKKKKAKAKKKSKNRDRS
jgi:ArsR family metal-binding transcriptional regulator